jgi:hypothetical protein
MLELSKLQSHSRIFRLCRSVSFVNVRIEWSASIAFWNHQQLSEGNISAPKFEILCKKFSNGKRRCFLESHQMFAILNTDFKRVIYPVFSYDSFILLSYC